MKKFLYRVQDGDSVLGLASRFNACLGQLIFENNLTKEICAGDILLIEPMQSFYRVDITDTIDSLAKRFNTTPEIILSQNKVPYIFAGLVIRV